MGVYFLALSRIENEIMYVRKYQKKVSRPLLIALVAGLIMVISPASLYAADTKNPAPNSTISIQDGEEDEIAQWGMPADVGRDEVEAYCGACHSLRLVAQQGLKREVWAELFIWMVEEQEMEEMPAEDSKLVLDYLSKHLGIHRKRR